jgi:hypothetical protein
MAPCTRGFDAAIHDLREAGVGGDVDYGNTGLFEKATSTSGGEDFKTELHKAADEGIESGFVTDTDERTTGMNGGHEVSGS